jgi:SAM-dependent methyltransferase
MSTANFWDERYHHAEYAYGKNPNLFFYQELQKLKPGSLLLPFEGEGRNAVAAAKLGWKVTAFDQSLEGKRKALLLAQENQVTIDYKTGQLQELNFPYEQFDAIGLIFAHLPLAERQEFHQAIIKKLKPQGILILEAFHEKQLGKSSGGPQQKEMLFTEEKLRADFQDLSTISMVDLETNLDEGLFHQGLAHVIRMVAQK